LSRLLTKRHRWLQLLRSALLAVVFLGLLGVPASALLGSAQQARGFLALDPRVARRFSWLGGASAHGSIWSLNVAGLEWIDAFALFSLLLLGATGLGVSTIALTGSIPSLLLTAALGRVFCGWICPMRLLLDLIAPLKRRLQERIGRFALPDEMARTRYAFLAFFAALTLALGSHAVSLLYPPAILARAATEAIFFQTLSWFLWAVVAYLLLHALLVTGLWCRYVCPGGVLYSLLGSFRALRIRLAEDKCTSCHLCARACPLGLEPTTESSGIECDNCGKCLSKCPSGALSYSWGYGRRSD